MDDTPLQTGTSTGTGTGSGTGSGTTINLSLVSHTNAGKTTLARTLLGRDIGEVRDAAHVTDIASGHVLVQSGDDTLMLWDTPGFGDTARLLSRLRMTGNPIGWMLTQVWDRWRERPLWSSQQAVKNAREQADVILYLVNAAEDPAAAPYVALEMEVLAWIGKPVLLLLNQMGPPKENVAADLRRWESHVGEYAEVAGALPLDAFARCWVQEGALLARVAPLLAPEKQPAMAGLAARWMELNRARFEASMEALAKPLAQALADREPVPTGDWVDQLGATLKAGKGGNREARKAMEALSHRLAEGTGTSTSELIRLHGLDGRATRKVLERLGDDYKQSEKASEGFSAVLGGLMSGAVTGLAADVMAGGLTLGGGLIVGGILGALGAGGIAHGINLAKGEEGSSVRWSEKFFKSLYGAALLRYLAVAHFGRGRGEWEEGEHPQFWLEFVDSEVERQGSALASLYAKGKRTEPGELESDLVTLLKQSGERLLQRLYPGALTGVVTASTSD
ncbi:GTPase domain-containing protein [Altererythrobacter aquiaggeris]|uniref:GTPase domain-containing protein n=1 Tax=Aestuarierythrobacter aquiaggeris TaxID=1898396 RepID=UPI00301AD541